MTKIVSSVKRHPWWLGIGLLVIGGGVWASWDVLSLALTPEPAVSRVVPTPSRLVSESGETVYRIDPESSEVTVSVVEELAGVDQTVDLTTRAIGGDLGLDKGDLSQSRVGDIQVDAITRCGTRRSVSRTWKAAITRSSRCRTQLSRACPASQLTAKSRRSRSLAT